LDEESERALVEVQRRTGLSVSGALKHGLMVAGDAIRGRQSPMPYEIYRAIELGPGGYAKRPARRAKAAIRALLRKDRQRGGR